VGGICATNRADAAGSHARRASRGRSVGARGGPDAADGLKVIFLTDSPA